MDIYIPSYSSTLRVYTVQYKQHYYGNQTPTMDTILHHVLDFNFPNCNKYIAGDKMAENLLINNNPDLIVIMGLGQISYKVHGEYPMGPKCQ